MAKPWAFGDLGNDGLDAVNDFFRKLGKGLGTSYLDQLSRPEEEMDISPPILSPAGQRFYDLERTIQEMGGEPAPPLPAYPKKGSESLKALYSGLEILKGLGVETEGWPGPAQTAADIGLSPLTWGTVFAGPSVSGALKGGPLAARLAASAVEPFVRGGPAARLAAETAVGTAAGEAARITGEHVPPGPLGLAAQIGAGLAAGGLGVGLLGARGAARRTIEAQLKRQADDSLTPDITEFLGREALAGRIPELPSDKVILESIFPDSLFRKTSVALGKVPGLRQALAVANPRSVAADDIRRAKLLYTAKAEYQTQIRSGVLAELAMRKNPLRLNKEGIHETLGIHWDDIMSRPATWSALSIPEQRLVRTLDQMGDEIEAMRRRHGVKVFERDVPVGEKFWSRLATEIRGIETEVKVRPGVGAKQFFQRARSPLHDTATENIATGTRYQNDPVAHMDTLIGAVQKAIIDKELADQLKPLGRTIDAVLKAGYPTEITARFEAGVAYREARDTFRILQHAARGERLTQRQLALIERVNPEWAKTAAAATGRRGWRQRAAILRPLVDEAEALTKRRWTARQGAARVVVAIKDNMAGGGVVPGQAWGSDEAMAARLVYNVPGLRGRLFPQKDAKAIDDILGQYAPGWLRVLSALSGTMKVPVAGLDFGFHMITGPVVVAQRPVVGLKALGRTIQTFLSLDPAKTNAAYIAANPRTVQQMAPYGMFVNLRMGIPDISDISRGLAPLAAKLPSPVRTAGSALIRQTFGRFEAAYEMTGNVMRIEMAKALAPLAKDERALFDLANFLNEATGYTATRGMGISPTQRAGESFLMFSSRYRRAVAALAIHGMQGGPFAQEARNGLSTLAAVAVLGYTATALALGQEPKLDPRRGDFLTVEIEGVNIGMGSAFVSGTRLLANSIEAARTDPERFLSLDDRTNPILRFMRGSESPPASLVTDALSGRTYIGEPIDNGWDVLERLPEHLVPFWVQATFFEQTGAAGAGAEMAGLRAYPLSVTQQLTQAAEETLGVTGKEFYGLEPIEQAAVLNAHPELREERLEQRSRSALETSRLAAATEKVSLAYRKEQEASDKKWGPGEDWRDERKLRLARKGGEIQATQAQYPDAARTLEGRHQELVAKAERGKVLTPEEERDKALGDYYAIFDQVRNRDTGELDAEALGDALDKLYLSWSPEVQTYVKTNTGLYRTALEQEYIQDTKKLQSYWRVADRVFGDLKYRYEDVSHFKSYSDMQRVASKNTVRALDLKQSAGYKAIMAEIAKEHDAWIERHPLEARLLYKWGYRQVSQKALEAGLVR